MRCLALYHIFTHLLVNYLAKYILSLSTSNIFNDSYTNLSMIFIILISESIYSRKKAASTSGIEGLILIPEPNSNPAGVVKRGLI